LLELASRRTRASIRPASSRLCRLSSGSRPPTSASRRPTTNVSAPLWRAGGASLLAAPGSRLTATSGSIGSGRTRPRPRVVGPIGQPTPVLVRVWPAKR
jgi:hypothetical protein